MGGKVPESIRRKVLREWIEGIPRLQIARDNQIGTGTVSEIIKAIKERDGEAQIDTLREIAIMLRREGLSIDDFAQSIHLKQFLNKIGLNDEQLEDLDLGVELAQKELAGVLLFQDTTRPVDVNVPLTITFTGTGVPPNLVTTIPATESAFFSVPFEPPTNPGTYTVQAHFAGTQIPAGTLSPSDSGIQMFTVP